MNLILTRKEKTDKSVFGELQVDGEFQCLILENISTLVPCGTYKIELTFSPHFHRLMPLLDVPGREGIRIHPANYPSQLEGCLAPGTVQDLASDAVWNSNSAFEPLYDKITKAINNWEDVSISISESY